MGFFREEYWIGLPFPSPWDLPNPGIEPSLLAVLQYKTECLKFGKNKQKNEVASLEDQYMSHKKRWPLAVQWLTPHFQCRELGFDPWSGN